MEHKRNASLIQHHTTDSTVCKLVKRIRNPPHKIILNQDEENKLFSTKKTRSPSIYNNETYILITLGETRVWELLDMYRVM